MSLSIGSRRFAPKAWASVLTALLVAAFVSLGWWQVGRAHEKRAMMDSFERGAATSVVLDGAVIDELPRYQHVSAAGQYEPARQILLDNMPSSTGQPGYRVLTPLRREAAGRILLVDRGWVPLGATRQHTPAVAVEPGPRTVTGRLDGLPVPGLRVGNAQALARRAGHAYSTSRRRPTSRQPSGNLSSRGSFCSTHRVPTVTSATGARRSAFRRSAISAMRSSGSRWR